MNEENTEIDLTFDEELKESETQEVEYKGTSKLRYTPTPEKPDIEIPQITRKRNQSMDEVHYPGKPYQPGEFDPFVK